MKNLIYSSFVLFIVLIVASCQKEPLVQQSKTIQPPDSLVAVSMVNNSSTPYEVSFQGTTKHTAYIQPGGRQSVIVKAGSYNIEVYPSGSSSYVSHTISWNGLSRITPRANFDVLIAPASAQQLLIY